MAPRRAAQEFLKLTPEALAYRVTLYGSLAATGRGHLTDAAITDVLAKSAPVTIEWRPQEVLSRHPNGMMFEALDEDGAVMRSWTTFSVGGGALSDDVNEGVALYDKLLYAISWSGVRAKVIASGSMSSTVREAIYGAILPMCGRSCKMLSSAVSMPKAYCPEDWVFVARRAITIYMLTTL